MTALTAPRNTLKKLGDIQGYPVKGGVILYQGGIAGVEAGLAVPGGTADSVSVGRVEQTVDATNAVDGELNVTVEAGIFQLASDGSIVAANIGVPAYLADDQTVTSTSTQPLAGNILAVDAGGVWVRIGI
ncbi:MAG: hypothetical protein LBS89_02860 [Zoogloeaceae bacterium]|jgi:hypothetical protein|nr:hypothetical protein [Zoogloeaceae bacterium]